MRRFVTKMLPGGPKGKLGSLHYDYKIVDTKLNKTAGRRTARLIKQTNHRGPGVRGFPDVPLSERRRDGGCVITRVHEERGCASWDNFFPKKARNEKPREKEQQSRFKKLNFKKARERERQVLLKNKSRTVTMEEEKNEKNKVPQSVEENPATEE